VLSDKPTFVSVPSTAKPTSLPVAELVSSAKFTALAVVWNINCSLLFSSNKPCASSIFMLAEFVSKSPPSWGVVSFTISCNVAMVCVDAVPNPRFVLAVPALFKSDKLFATVKKFAAVNAASWNALPLKTLRLFEVVLKYKSPAVRASPSLSVEGSEDFAPRKMSSKLSNAVSAAVFAVSAAVLAVSAAVADVAAAVADDAALVACVDAVEAELEAAVADEAAAVALEAAAVWLVVAEEASTNKSYLAEFAFVVKGCEPEDVCAVLTIKILFVDVSFTISRPT